MKRLNEYIFLVEALERVHCFQLKRLNELEDIVADQDNSIAALREKLTKARQEIGDWRFKFEEQIKQQDAEKDK